MTPLRTLIVNADDLGYTPLTSAGIFRAWREGIVTSASLMVRQPDAAAAARRAALEGFTDLGLHLDFGEWTCEAGEWRRLYEVIPLDDPAAVRDEAERQLERFRELVGRDPTHLDSHQHVHREEPVRSAACEIATRLGIVLRGFSPTVAYQGGFYGQHGDGLPAPECLTADSILGMLAEATAPVVELGCHPGLDSELATMYRAERIAELGVLCGPGLLERIHAAGFALGSFAALGPQPRPEPQL